MPTVHDEQWCPQPRRATRTSRPRRQRLDKWWHNPSHLHHPPARHARAHETSTWRRWSPHHSPKLGDTADTSHNPGTEASIPRSCHLRHTSRPPCGRWRYHEMQTTCWDNTQCCQCSLSSSSNERRDHKECTHPRRVYGHPCHHRLTQAAILLPQNEIGSRRLHQWMCRLPEEDENQFTPKTHPSSTHMQISIPEATYRHSRTQAPPLELNGYSHAGMPSPNGQKPLL